MIKLSTGFMLVVLRVKEIPSCSQEGIIILRA
jgi:hypothetical protein